MPFSRHPSHSCFPSAALLAFPLLLSAPLWAKFTSPVQAAEQPAGNAPALSGPGPVPPGTRIIVPATPSGKAVMPVEPSRLSADKVRYEGGVIILEGNAERPARFLSSAGEITAQNVRVDTENQTVKASGGVVIKRSRVTVRKVLRASNLPTRYQREAVVETTRGDNLDYDFKTRIGQLDKATLELADFELSVAKLTINGEKYVAQNVILRPGGQSPAEDKIYGVPPLNLRAKSIVLTVPDKSGTPSVRLKGAALYFKNTRLIPVPSIGRQISSSREKDAFSITPGLSLNSADRILLTAKILFPLDETLNGLSFVTDLGASARLGFRGGLGLELDNSLGRMALRGKIKDIVPTQLTNRIQLDRLPELSYESPNIRLLKLPGGRQTALRLEGSWGNFRENLINITGNLPVKSTRRMAGVHFTTRFPNRDRSVPAGPYIDVFATTARYSLTNLRYRTTGYEIGYDGRIAPKWSGVVSYRDTKLRGDTPFRFDEVEIPREVRTTLDYRYSPRYIVPLDFRYDIDRHDLRDASFGLLRAYKSFAYGLTYNTARSSLHFEMRTGF